MRGVDPRSSGRRAPRRAITSRKRDATHPPDFSPPFNRSWRSPRRKCTRERPPDEESVLGIRVLRPRHSRRVESCGSTLRFHPFASERFHVLLNSLFKVLFNFPSRYLFAIGLVLYLALDGVYHPLWAALTSNPTPRTLRAEPTIASTGLTPAMGKAPIRRTWAFVRSGRGCPKRHSSR